MTVRRITNIAILVEEGGSKQRRITNVALMVEEHLPMVRRISAVALMVEELPQPVVTGRKYGPAVQMT